MRHCGKLVLMESRIECHSKTIDFPFDQSGEFHNHNGYEVLLLLGGEINLYTEYGGTHMRPGDLVCIPAYEFHRAELLTERQYDRVVINILDTELPASVPVRQIWKNVFCVLRERSCMWYICRRKRLSAFAAGRQSWKKA